MAGPRTIETGDAPIKAWTDGVPVEDAGARAAAQRRAPAVHPPPRRGHARRALGHRRDRRLRDPDQGRDHPGGGRRRHRLRHDGGAHHAAPPSDLPDNLAQAARSAIEAAVPHGRTGARAAGATAARGATPSARRFADERAGRAATSELERQAPEARATRRRVDAPRHARRRQPLHRGLPRRGATACGSCCTRARAASATASARYFIELAQARRCERQLIQPARPGPRLPARRASRCFDDYVEAVGWAQDFARANRELMMAARGRRVAREQLAAVRDATTRR